LLGITSCLPANSIQEWTFSVFYAITKPSQSNLDIILSRFISRPNLHIIAPAGFWPLEIVFTIAAPAFDILFIGCVLNTKISYTTAEKLTSEALKCLQMLQDATRRWRNSKATLQDLQMLPPCPFSPLTPYSLGEYLLAPSPPELLNPRWRPNTENTPALQASL